MKRSPSPHNLVIGVILLTLSCATVRAQSTTRPATAPSTAESGSKYLRFVPESGGTAGTLQTSIVTFRNADGATVDLIAAIHVADGKFFRELDQSFTQYDSLLYEMVKPKDADMGQLTGRSTTAPGSRALTSRRSLGWVTIMQQFLKNNLDLTFQLEEIDYTRKNFVHADLDVDTFLQMQEERGESLLTLMLQQMLQELTRQEAKAAAGEVQPGLGDLILALQSPDRARQLKLILAKQFDQIDEMTSGFDGPNGTVLVTERNKAAIKVLQQRLAAGEKKLGVFYGAAHLKGMEKILTGQMGFKQVGEPKWLIAWDMRAATTQPTTRP
jgi:hypothetical protein